MVLVSHLYQFIHIRNFKVASTSVEVFFTQFCIDPSMKKRYDFTEIMKKEHNQYGAVGYNEMSIQTHMPVKEIKKEFGEEIFKKYIKFCVVRNPYDRVVSIYHWNLHHQKKRMGHKPNFIPLGFKEFCRAIRPPTPEYMDEHLHNLTRILDDGKPSCDYYLRFENLKEDIMMLLGILGITDYVISTLPNFKADIRPKDKHYREYYDDETREIVYRAFKYEFDMFGYTF